MASIVVFTIASYLCGNSDSLIELTIFRIIQGLAGGGLLSTSQSIYWNMAKRRSWLCLA